MLITFAYRITHELLGALATVARRDISVGGHVFPHVGVCSSS